MTTVNGVVGVSSGELARYAIFYASLMQLEKPPGTVQMLARSSVISENRNGIAEQALALGADWVLYLDDDQVLAPDTLTKLLARDKDIVSGLYVARAAPFQPHVYDIEDEKGWCKFRPLTPGSKGLVKVKAVGAGCMLVKTEVFRKMERPWWRLGQIIMDGWGDDLNFCHRAREAGFEVWADLEIAVGHQLNGTVWPKRDENGVWTTVLVEGNKPICTFPAIIPEDAQ